MTCLILLYWCNEDILVISNVNTQWGLQPGDQAGLCEDSSIGSLIVSDCMLMFSKKKRKHSIKMHKDLSKIFRGCLKDWMKTARRIRSWSAASPRPCCHRRRAKGTSAPTVLPYKPTVESWSRTRIMATLPLPLPLLLLPLLLLRLLLRSAAATAPTSSTSNSPTNFTSLLLPPDNYYLYYYRNE